MRNSGIDLSSCSSHVNNNKSQTGSRNFKSVCFGSAMYVLKKKYNFLPVSCKPAAAKISYRSEFVMLDAQCVFTLSPTSTPLVSRSTDS